MHRGYLALLIATLIWLFAASGFPSRFQAMRRVAKITAVRFIGLFSCVAIVSLSYLPGDQKRCCAQPEGVEQQS